MSSLRSTRYRGQWSVDNLGGASPDRRGDEGASLHPGFHLLEFLQKIFVQRLHRFWGELSVEIEGLVQQPRQLSDQTGKHFHAGSLPLLGGEEVGAEESLPVLVDPSVHRGIDGAGENHCERSEIFGLVAGEFSEEATKVSVLLLDRFTGKLGWVDQAGIGADHLEPFEDAGEL